MFIFPSSFEINFNFNLSFVHPNLDLFSWQLTKKINSKESYFNYFDDSQYYDGNSFTNYIGNNRPKSINIIHINIQSARKKLDEFLINLERTKSKFQVIILTKTWLNCQEDFNKIAGFNSFHSFRPKKGDGVSILIQSNITAIIIRHLTAVNEVFKSLAVELVYNNDKFRILDTYKPPSTSLADFNAIFF